MLRKMGVFICLISFLMNNIYANPGKIRKYATQIDKSYRTTAKSMIVLSIAHAESTILGQVRLNKFILEIIGRKNKSEKNLLYRRKFILDLLRPASSKKEEIEILNKEYSKLKSLKNDFFEKSISSEKNSKRIFQFINSPKGFCSNESYMQMMGVMELTGEKGIIFLMESLDPSISVSYSSDSGTKVNTKTDKNELLVAASIAVTQVLVSSLVSAKVMTFFGSTNAIFSGLAAGTMVGVAVLLIQSFIARTLERDIAVANQELYEKLKLNKGIRQYYIQYCRQVSSSYEEVKDIIYQYDNGLTSLDSIKKMSLNIYKYLKNKYTDLILGYSSHLIHDKNDFSNYIKLILLKKFIFTQEDKNSMKKEWGNIIHRIDQMIEIIEKAIYEKLYTKRVSNITESDINFMNYMNSLNVFMNLKKEFNSKLLKYFNEEDPTLKERSYQSLQDCLNNFELNNLVKTSEENETILFMKNILKDLKL